MIEVLLFLLVFYYSYVLFTAIYRAHLKKQLRWFHYIIFAPALVIAYLLDILAQYTVATVIFMDRPQEHLVTDRLQRYLANPNHKHFKKAKWFCENMLDIFDPTGKHC
jgi:hypothetical protein